MAKKILCSVISFILCAVIAFVSCYFAIPDFNAWVKGKITDTGLGGNTDDDKVNGDAPDKPIDGDINENGGTVIDEVENNGISLLSAKLPRAAYAANDIDPQADSAYMLTAVVEPADASDKNVVWSIAWKNSESTFASGKTVTDYVTITPTSDGALTARAVCKQAFGEQIIISVKPVKGDSTVRANCTVDYVQKFLGLGLKTNFNNGEYGFELSSADTSASIDFPVYTDGEVWGYCLTQSSFSKFNLTARKSDIYTKALKMDSQDDYYAWSGYKICATQDYLNALRVGGSSVNASAENYKADGSDYFGSFFFTNWGSYIGNWSNFLSSLRANSDKVMLRVKFYANTNYEDTAIGVCDIKFNPESIAALITNITINGNIEF